ncbi:MAG TPA: MgtC/SapB family protein [Candidatus Dormibacteraeota bacterium]|nr:MgtC/SapB family protein [Candidatus Dormibacteraeota bacterium]HEX2681865.1 MgtC/SapB family protein [Candidatus Dormibacteraeota bacterium]
MRRTGREEGPGGADTPVHGELELAARIVVALVIGLALGAEREFRGYATQTRTMALIAVGSCMFAGLGLMPGFVGKADPTRIAAQIVAGVGFLGAGSILRQGIEIRGLTTAATIWVVASLGMAVGFGFFVLALVATALVLAAQLILKPIEERVFPTSRETPPVDKR